MDQGVPMAYKPGRDECSQSGWKLNCQIQAKEDQMTWLKGGALTTCPPPNEAATSMARNSPVVQAPLRE